MNIIGIDPGVSGAVALYRLDGHVETHDMPVTESRGSSTKKEIDCAALDRLLATLLESGPAEAYVEKVGSMPGQGISSTFAFGVTVGCIKQALASRKVPVTYVTPQVWKKALGVPAAKDGARARASEIFPAFSCLWARAKDDGRAEAAMIARYGLLKAQADFKAIFS